jgi:hypothetical protein
MTCRAGAPSIDVASYLGLGVSADMAVVLTAVVTAAAMAVTIACAPIDRYSDVLRARSDDRYRSSVIELLTDGTIEPEDAALLLGYNARASAAPEGKEREPRWADWARSGRSCR